MMTETIDPALGKPVSGWETVEEMNKVLTEFKQFILDEYPKASSLYEGAKNLFEEIKAHWCHDKKVRGMTSDQFDQDMERLFQKQTDVWDRLLLAAHEETEKVKEAYEKVVEASQAVRHARGEGLCVACLGFPTPEQCQVRQMWHQQLRFHFDEATREKDALLAYPDGLLTQVGLIRNRALQETAKLSDQWHRRDHNPHQEQEVTP